MPAHPIPAASLLSQLCSDGRLCVYAAGGLTAQGPRQEEPWGWAVAQKLLLLLLLLGQNRESPRPRQEELSGGAVAQKLLLLLLLLVLLLLGQNGESSSP